MCVRTGDFQHKSLETFKIRVWCLPLTRRWGIALVKQVGAEPGRKVGKEET